MIVNIFGSTGEIGSRSLKILLKNFPTYKINFLFANSNYKKLILQTNIYKPKYICINNLEKINYIKKKINSYTKIIYPNDLQNFLKLKKSDLTVLSISGYSALYYLQSIISNTNYLGLVNKECIVSAGHILFNFIKKKRVKIFPLDSEHYSLKFFFDNEKLFSKYTNIYLTASGGPFLNKKKETIKNVKFSDAIKHPTWKMGYKNSIDSATLANKCLEIIEAHYLFNIPYKNIKILIHQQSLVHSVIEMENNTSSINYFYHDMSIPLFNFFSDCGKKYKYIKKNKYSFPNNIKLEFNKVSEKQFPIFKIFNRMNKNIPSNNIKFNCSNEFAVDLFKNNKIKYIDIPNIIKWGLSLNLKFDLNTIDNVIIYQKKYMNLLKSKYVKKSS